MPGPLCPGVRAAGRRSALSAGSRGVRDGYIRSEPGRDAADRQRGWADPAQQCRSDGETRPLSGVAAAPGGSGALYLAGACTFGRQGQPHLDAGRRADGDSGRSGRRSVAAGLGQCSRWFTRAGRGVAVDACHPHIGIRADRGRRRQSPDRGLLRSAAPPASDRRRRYRHWRGAEALWHQLRRVDASTHTLLPTEGGQ